MAGFANQQAIPRSPARKSVRRYSPRNFALGSGWNPPPGRRNPKPRRLHAFQPVACSDAGAGRRIFDRPPGEFPRAILEDRARQIFVHVVTVPEGWTKFDIAAELDRQGICARENFLAAANDPSPISDLAPRAKTLEGFLFPSTYEFTRHTTCEQIAGIMVHHFRAVWETTQSFRITAISDGPTARQLVSLASLVERETPNPTERPLVAGVFYNRLRINKPLQCDPTVQYAMNLAGHPEKNVRPEDLRIDSPYNTYLHRGLPPGPIANPGEASLRAALTPTQTDYMYFVANDQGGHFFSRTLAEHNRNVVRYRHLLAGEAPPPDQKPGRNIEVGLEHGQD